MKKVHFFIVPVLIFVAAFGFAQETSSELYDSPETITDVTDVVETMETMEATEVTETEEVLEETEEVDTTETAETAETMEATEVAKIEEEPEETEETDTTEAAETIPRSIVNNQYFLQSVQLSEQARTAYEAGDYGASAAYAEQAAEQARLSDAYVAMRLAETAIARAHSRYTWANSVGAADRYPSEYQIATDAYNEAVEAREGEDWDNVIDASNRVLDALANVRGPENETGPIATPLRSSDDPRDRDAGTLPAQYTVRQWNVTGDSFSTIAGWSWVYGDPHQWRVLYEANKHKLPNPNNPHLILPGMVMDIPSLRGEARSGMWDPSSE